MSRETRSLFVRLSFDVSDPTTIAERDEVEDRTKRLLSKCLQSFSHYVDDTFPNVRFGWEIE